MTIFLILAPYGAFALLMLVTSATVSLLTGAAICLAVMAFDMVRGRSMKILGAVSVIVVAAVGGYVILIAPNLIVACVKIAIYTGLFLLTLISIVIRLTFLLQYARES